MEAEGYGQSHMLKMVISQKRWKRETLLLQTTNWK